MSEAKPRRARFVDVAESSSARIGAMLTTSIEPQRSGPPPLLRGLSDQERSEVVKIGARRILYKGATLFNQGRPQNGIYLIESGRIKVFYAAPSGRAITLAYWHPGNFVGGPEVFDHGVHIWSGVAAVNSSVLHLPGQELRKMIARMPKLGVNIIEGLAFKGKCYSGMAQMLGTRSATERLAYVLLQLMDLYGVHEDEGVLIAANFTHADISNMIGATRQWVTINLQRFAEQGILHSRRSHLVIQDPTALFEIRDGLEGKGAIEQATSAQE